MSVSSKLVMTVENPNVFKIINKVEKTLNNMLRKELRNIHGETVNCFVKDENNHFSVASRVSAGSELVTLSFRYKGEDRVLWVFFNTSNDNRYMTNKPNVTFSLNAWGNHEEILKTIQKELAEENKEEFFFDFDDCSNNYFKVENEELIEVESNHLGFYFSV